jgi:hypothetical protein
MSGNIWKDNPELGDELVRLWNEGRSAEQIAFAFSHALGIEVTRSAILGRKQRLAAKGVVFAVHKPPEAHDEKTRLKRERQARFKARQRAIARGETPPEFPRPPGRPSKPREARPVVVRLPAPKPQPDAISAACSGNPVSIIKRRMGEQCAWPLDGRADDGFMLVCGDPTEHGLSYCPVHGDLARDKDQRDPHIFRMNGWGKAA